MQATLRAIRVHLGISIDEAARRIGIPKNRLIAIEKHRTCPSWQLIKRFMRVLIGGSRCKMVFLL